MTRAQKYRDITKFLKSKGWAFRRQKGSHEIWGPQEGGLTFALVQHNGEVSPGVVRQLQRLFVDTPKSWN